MTQLFVSGECERYKEHKIDYITNQHRTGIVHGLYICVCGQVYILGVHRYMVVHIKHITNTYKIYI